MRSYYKIIILIGLFCIASAFTHRAKKPYFLYSNNYDSSVLKDSVKKDSIIVDSLGILIPFKDKAHASYYADKFTGRRTASGAIFDNKKYTAAHRKLPFGTKLKITNPVNGKWVVVVVNDRGPFVKSRDIDLSKAAFRFLAHNKGAGVMHVSIDLIE